MLVSGLQMSTEKQAVTIQDLAEEAKKRVVFLIMCALGLSYLLSLTSSSVWANLPAATFLIVTLRYFYLDFEMRIKAAVYNSKPTLAHISSEMKPFEGPKTGLMKSDWRRKVNSPVVEDALDHFTRHLVSEWVTDLWYSRLTPDRQGPEELVQIMNGVLGEISFRLRNVNLVDLLTRDIINILCTHLELFRSCRSKIEKQQRGPLTFERREMELKSVLFADNKLHPALFSAEAEHKVLQYLMDGLIPFTFKPEDLQCSLFCFIVRELLACAVMRPLLNLANPRFLNERVECVVTSLSKANKGASTALVAPQSKSNASSRISSDQFSGFLDPSVKGVELVPLKKDPSKTLEEKSMKDNANGTFYSKDPLLSMDAGSTRSWSSLPPDPQNGDDISVQRHSFEENRVDTLDVLSSRKTDALAPDHSENYRRKEDEKDTIEPEIESSSVVYKTADTLNVSSREKEKNSAAKISSDQSTAVLSGPNGKIASHISAISYVDYDGSDLMRLEEVESGSSSYTSQDEESSSVTGLDSPVTKVWDGKNNRYLSVSHIHHPLESSDGLPTRKTGIGHLQARLHRTQSRRKRSNRLSSQKRHIWQEVGRTSFSSGDGRDILNSFKRHVESEDSSDDYEAEVLGRIHSGATASSSTSSTSLLDCDNLAVNAPKNSLLADTFLKLRCEVLGANIVKGGSRTFAVYSISVTDTNDNSWSIKRRFRHFEELHRRLKEFPEYNLRLPPKRFLSTGLDVLVIQERCKLLHKYLKKLLQLPTISGSIETWDFLSVDSQTYLFPHSISIIETLSVDLDSTTHERSEEFHNGLGPTVNTIPSNSEHHDAESKESVLALNHNILGDGSRVKAQVALHTKQQKPSEDSGSYFDKSDQRNISLSRKSINRSESDDLQTSSQSIIGASSDPTLPTEWVPPNLSAHILDLVDVIFQLQDGGWIRRKAFWAAKQILQLGMGDAFDDWLIEKIQLLRRGSVVASGIKRIEQVLWPDGIFIAKHPKRRRLNPSRSTPGSSPRGQPPTSISSPKKVDAFELDENQLKEDERRARFVHELMIDNAPAAIVGLVGHKGYEQCAKDLYDFLQSSVCLKQLAFDLLELLLLSAFPEMDYIFRQLHEEKEKFGEFRPT